jgi:sulfur-oxidizing protein SoxA
MHKRVAMAAAVVIGVLSTGTAANASPQQDLQAFRNYFKTRFPDVAFDDYVNGPYALDKSLRAQWKSIMEFPPYAFALDEGKKLFHTPFKTGKTYADCFENGGVGVRQNYPYFDKKRGQIVTLELAINQCREKHGEKPLQYKKGKMAALSAYMSYMSRGKRFDIKVPDDPKALAAYRKGKEYFYSRHGQLGFSCASCHVQEAGKKVRAQLLAPALGIVASFPIYRSKWGSMGTLDRRFGGCNRNVRAKPFKAQSETYRDLEYFLTYMSNGLPVAGPGSRP